MALDEQLINPLDTLQDGQWHWIPRVLEESLAADTPTTLWIHGAPTKPGYYPREEADGLRVIYHPEAGITYLGMDIYATNGHAEALGRRALAAIVPWPSPEFMSPDNRDSDLFIRLWTPEEIEAGDVHLPLFYKLEEGTIRQLAAGRNRS